MNRRFLLTLAFVAAAMLVATMPAAAAECSGNDSDDPQCGLPPEVREAMINDRDDRDDRDVEGPGPCEKQFQEE